jgi:hypothetical protein
MELTFHEKFDDDKGNGPAPVVLQWPLTIGAVGPKGDPAPANTLSIVIRSTSLLCDPTLPDQTACNFVATSHCEDGESITGGGFALSPFSPGPGDQYIEQNGPTEDNGWIVRTRNLPNAQQPVTLTVNAICAKIF